MLKTLRDKGSAVLFAMIGGAVEAIVGFQLTNVYDERRQNAQILEYPTSSIPTKVRPMPIVVSSPNPPTEKPDRVKPAGAVTGKDQEGREADFLFRVISQELHWKKGGVEILDAAGKPVALQDYLRSPGLQKDLAYPGLIAVGTASCEEDRHTRPQDRREEEEGRARTRSVLLVGWLRPVLPKEAPGQLPQALYRLNLGQFKDDECASKGTDSQKTSDQRKVALIAITWMQESVEVRDALRNALKEHRLLGFDPQKYSLWPGFEWQDMTQGEETPATPRAGERA